MQNREIIQDIDATLDQLIRNAEMLSKSELQELSETEVDGFQKTQESLLQHLLEMDQILEKRTGLQDKRLTMYKIREKKRRFETLNSQCQNLTSHLIKQNLIRSKRRGKRSLEQVKISDQVLRN